MYNSDPMPANGDSTVSPGLDHSRTHRSMNGSCSGQMWRMSASSRATRSFRVSVSRIPNQPGHRCSPSPEWSPASVQMGEAHWIQSSLLTANGLSPRSGTPVLMGAGLSPGFLNSSR